MVKEGRQTHEHVVPQLHFGSRKQPLVGRQQDSEVVNVNLGENLRGSLKERLLR